MNEKITPPSTDPTEAAAWVEFYYQQGWSDGLPLVRAPLDPQSEGWFRPPPALGEHTDEILAELEKGSE